MQFDLSRLSAAQIALFAAAATVLAGVIGATAAVLIAVVNAGSARRIARETARREFRLKTIQPFLTFLDQRIAFFHELMDEGARLSASLTQLSGHIKAADKDKVDQQVKHIRGRLDTITSTLLTAKTVYNSASFFSQALWAPRVLDTLVEWTESDAAFVNEFVSLGGFTTNVDKLKRLHTLAAKALNTSANLRMVLEDSLFASRGWTKAATTYGQRLETSIARFARRHRTRSLDSYISACYASFVKSAITQTPGDKNAVSSVGLLRSVTTIDSAFLFGDTWTLMSERN